MPTSRGFSGTIYVKASTVAVLSIVTALIATLVGLSGEQALALTVFLVMIYATLLLWSQRLPFAFLGIFLLFFLGLLDIECFVKYSHLDVIAFLIATMSIVGYLEEDKYFEFIAQEVIRRVGISFKTVFIIVLFLSGFLAPLVDEVTSILVISSIIFALCKNLEIDSFPLLLAAIFATNIGSAMTPLGNPVGVLIAFESGYTFIDFLRWSTPISILSLLIASFILVRQYRTYIEEGDSKIREKISNKEPPERVEIPKKMLLKDTVIFSLTMVLIALHHPLEELFSIERNALLLGIPFLIAGLIMIVDPTKGFHAFESKVEWSTLVFFLLLFSSVGALEKSGIIRLLSATLSSYAGMGIEILMSIFVVAAVLMSAFMDNVIAVAVLSQVVHGLKCIGMNDAPFWWLALFSAVYAGNLTPIGSTANIVAASLLEKKYGRAVSFEKWLRSGLPVTVITILIALLAIYLQLPLM